MNLDRSVQKEFIEVNVERVLDRETKSALELPNSTQNSSYILISESQFAAEIHIIPGKGIHRAVVESPEVHPHVLIGIDEVPSCPVDPSIITDVFGRQMGYDEIRNISASAVYKIYHEKGGPSVTLCSNVILRRSIFTCPLLS